MRQKGSRAPQRELRKHDGERAKHETEATREREKETKMQHE